MIYIQHLKNTKNLGIYQKQTNKKMSPSVNQREGGRGKNMDCTVVI